MGFVYSIYVKLIDKSSIYRTVRGARHYQPLSIKLRGFLFCIF